MTARQEEIEAFIASAGLGRVLRERIAGDVSARRYERIRSKQGTHVLMIDAPGAAGEVNAYVAMTRFLAAKDITVPQILTAAPDRGLVLMEDLGEDRLAESAHGRPALEARAYGVLANLLVTLQTLRLDEAPSLPAYDIGFALEEARLAFDWYLPAIHGAPREELIEPFVTALRDALMAVRMPECVVLRDLHAENLFWLPHREGDQRIGMIDFQGARFGHPVYDLVSLLTDARRDVSPSVTAAVFATMQKALGPEWRRMQSAFAVWSLQRNLKILGIFARSALRDGKTHNLHHLPRVWGHVQAALEHPAVAGVSSFVGPLPPPDRQSIEWIRSRA